MKQYTVTGMSCAACQARVEKAVSQVDGVTSCAVSLLTNSMGVEGSATEAAIIKAVTDAGYGAELKGNRHNTEASTQEDALIDRETPVLKKRLFSSIGFLAILMYVSMGHTMLGLPLPAFLEGNPIAIALTELLLTVIVMIINQKFFINGYKSLINRAPNMDALVALGSSAAFGYSTWALYMMTASDNEAMMSYMHDLYFESAATILTLITIGKMLEARSKGKTTDALKGLLRLAPKTANVIRDGAEQTVSVDQVNKGDVFVVRPGESIPVDGIVLEGESAIDESSLTGESIPEDKSIGSSVSAGTLNQSGFLRCEATRVGEDTTLSQIIRMVSDAAATKAPIAKAADQVSGVFVPVVIGISLITLAAWLLAGQSSGYAIARAISVLVISCPCALGLATPVAIMVGNGVGARNGILFKTASSLEQTGKAAIVVLDKTGTITQGEPYVTDIISDDEDELLKLAYSLESKSEHPLARAVVRYAEEKAITAINLEAFEIKPGNGLTAKSDSKYIYGGNLKFVGQHAEISANLKKKAEALAEEGKTPLFFAREGVILGIIAVADVIKEDSPQAINELKNMGLKVVMLTGDNERTARAIAEKTEVDEVIAGVLPGDKERHVRRLKEYGRVIMVGDGINDAPALTSADIGIAIGAGSDIAIDAADVVLMKNRLIDVPAAIRLSRATLKNIYENLFWAFIYNTIGIPLAAGVFISILGWRLNPMIGAAAMSMSSFCVVTNALRLNLIRMHDSSKDRMLKNNIIIEKENATMTKTMIIEGMMCPHCEKHVKNALEALEGVESAAPSHVEGKAVVTLTAEVADEVLAKTVVDAGYEVKGIE